MAALAAFSLRPKNRSTSRLDRGVGLALLSPIVTNEVTPGVLRTASQDWSSILMRTRR